MIFHDAVLESAGMGADRAFRVRLVEIVGGKTTRAEFTVRRFQAVHFLGELEPDWFLSGVYAYAGTGEPLAAETLSGTSLMRLIVMGTNGASIEVMGGVADFEWLRD